MDAAILIVSCITALLSLLAALWLLGCINYDSGIGEPVNTAKPPCRRVRAGQPPFDIDATERAATYAALIDFDDDSRTDNPEMPHSPAFTAWAVTYEKTMHELRSSAAVTMLPTP